MYSRPPASVKVLGILNLVFAGIGVFGVLFTWAIYFKNARIGGANNPVIETARASSTYMSFLEVTLWTGVLAAGVLAAAGLGMLKMRAWGRRLAIGYALYAITSSIVGLVITYIMVLRPLADHPAAGAGMAGGIWGGVLSCVYPVILLWFMMKWTVVEAFARANPPKGTLPEARVYR